MNYIFISLLAASMYAVGILGEKFFIEHHGSVSEWSLVFLSTTTFAVVSVSFIPFTPIHFKIPVELWSLFLASGGLYAGAMILWFYAMNRESASKVGQLASLESIVTPIFGILLLGESPSKFALIAIGVIIIGLFFLVFDRGVARAISTTKVAVIPIFFCLLLWASQDTIIKIALLEENFWTVFFWTRVISFTCFIGLMFKQSVQEDLYALFSEFTHSNTHILLLSKVATTIGLLSAVYAMSLGPLSLVSPLLASYPVFVFIIAAVMSIYTNHTLENITSRYLLKRAISICLFIFGIAILYLV